MNIFNNNTAGSYKSSNNYYNNKNKEIFHKLIESRKQNISPRTNQIFNTQRENNKNCRPPFSSSFE